MMKRRRLLWLVGLVVVLGAALTWYQFAPRHTPAGQLPLATLDAASLANVKADFNRDDGATRIILLLSPT